MIDLMTSANSDRSAHVHYDDFVFQKLGFQLK